MGECAVAHNDAVDGHNEADTKNHKLKLKKADNAEIILS